MKKYVTLAFVLLVVGCSDGGKRVVDTSGANVATQSPEQAQKEAEADLPKP